MALAGLLLAGCGVADQHSLEAAVDDTREAMDDFEAAFEAFGEASAGGAGLVDTTGFLGGMRSDLTEVRAELDRHEAAILEALDAISEPRRSELAADWVAAFGIHTDGFRNFSYLLDRATQLSVDFDGLDAAAVDGWVELEADIAELASSFDARLDDLRLESLIRDTGVELGPSLLWGRPLEASGT